jgi:hypothetical protein
LLTQTINQFKQLSREDDAELKEITTKAVVNMEHIIYGISMYTFYTLLRAPTLKAADQTFLRKQFTKVCEQVGRDWLPAQAFEEATRIVPSIKNISTAGSCYVEFKGNQEAPEPTAAPAPEAATVQGAAGPTPEAAPAPQDARSPAASEAALSEAVTVDVLAAPHLAAEQGIWSAAFETEGSQGKDGATRGDVVGKELEDEVEIVADESQGEEIGDVEMVAAEIQPASPFSCVATADAPSVPKATSHGVPGFLAPAVPLDAQLAESQADITAAERTQLQTRWNALFRPPAATSGAPHQAAPPAEPNAKAAKAAAKAAERKAKAETAAAKAAEPKAKAAKAAAKAAEPKAKAAKAAAKAAEPKAKAAKAVAKAAAAPTAAVESEGIGGDCSGAAPGEVAAAAPEDVGGRGARGRGGRRGAAGRGRGRKAQASSMGAPAEVTAEAKASPAKRPRADVD